MARPLAQLWAAIFAFVVLGAASIVLTNALLNVASGKPSVTFSIVTATPSATR